MTETEAFLAAMLPRLHAADRALHNGDAAPRKALWTRTDPVTLFGAVLMTSGWPAIEAVFDRLAARFSRCASFEIEVEAAGASGDLAYLVAFERTTVSLVGDPPLAYVLRVTTLFRREDGDWKIVHRHADPAPDDASARDRLAAGLGAALVRPSGGRLVRADVHHVGRRGREAVSGMAFGRPSRYAQTIFCWPVPEMNVAPFTLVDASGDNHRFGDRRGHGPHAPAKVSPWRQRRPVRIR